MHTGTVFVFGCTGILILPFITIYTDDISDSNYLQPLFAVLITTANAGHCLRLPYNVMILAAGHYKQTQRCYIIAVIINIVLSITLVIFYGLIGVAIGTLAAMLYQTIWMAIYNSKHLMKRPLKVFIKQLMIDIISATIGVVATFWISLQSISYLSWIIMACKVAIIWLVVISIINYIFYHDKMIMLIQKMVRRKKIIEFLPHPTREKDPNDKPTK